MGVIVILPSRVGREVGGVVGLTTFVAVVILTLALITPLNWDPQSEQYGEDCCMEFGSYKRTGQ